MKFKLIIFDLGGTIADTLPLCIAAFKRSIEPVPGTTLTDAEIIATFGPSEEGTIRKLLPGQEEAGVKAYLQHYKELHYTCPVPFPGIKELLEYLGSENVLLAMVTGKGIHSTKISLEQFGLAQYFGITETGSPEGPNKITGIRNVLKQLNIDASDSLYIGDAPSDIKYCKEIGVPIAAAAWASTANADELLPLNPEWIFYSVSDFRKWIANHI